MRRRVWVVFASGVVLSLVLAATAFGQGATLRVDDQTPAPGQTITVNGSQFSSSNANGPVYLRLDSRTAEPVTDAAPDSAGNIVESFPVPRNLSRGWHLLIATQNTNANGRAVGFTPGRVRLNVGASQTGAAAPPGGGGRFPDSPLGLLALTAGLTLLAGAALTVRGIATRNRPRLGSQRR